MAEGAGNHGMNTESPCQSNLLSNGTRRPSYTAVRRLEVRAGGLLMQTEAGFGDGFRLVVTQTRSRCSPPPPGMFKHR